MVIICYPLIFSYFYESRMSVSLYTKFLPAFTIP